ncbi:hypothetical protein [Streptomyces roseolilacinus]|uniref:Uncharacterized protein n=1 Tax=Streptomyces roseolilacinus TaxID=66904 RepID=A0A918EL66_9ACTN|nr:hypothetical protein [Streptomyces roseolilacinus]GGQ05427.1 hypothetical protein GCM10010249_24860 [Streptomyces roseolilacinus]
MSTATFTSTARAPQAPGAAKRPSTRLGGALRAVRVFATAAFGVAVLGDYDADAAGVRRH